MKRMISAATYTEDEIKDMVDELYDMSWDGIKLAKKLNGEALNNNQASISGEVARLFAQAADLLDEYYEE